MIFILSQHINNSIIGHILNASKKVWEYLERLCSTSTKARKIQVKNELNNLRNSSNPSINVFILKIKEVSDALGSTGIMSQTMMTYLPTHFYYAFFPALVSCLHRAPTRLVHHEHVAYSPPCTTSYCRSVC